MKMIELTKEKFEEFASKSPYNNYCQTSNYGIFMSENNFNYSFIGYTTNDLEILAAGMFLIKKIGQFFYAYCPKGFIIDYNNPDLLRKFTNNLKKYFKRKNIIFLKINPEIPISTIDIKNDYNKNQLNTDILNNLKSYGFKKRKEIEPLQLLEPKITALIDLKKYNIENLDRSSQIKVLSTESKGLELEIIDSDKIEIFYDLVKNDYHNINYYRNLFNTFKKNEQADLLLVKVNYENYLIDAKQKVEEETTKNENLNLKLQEEISDENLKEKMESDKILEEYKQDVIYATQGLRKKENTYVAGALVIKYNNKISIVASGINEFYKHLNSDYFLYHQILEKYKNDYEIADLYEIADDFNENSKYKEFNKIKFDFNPTITEYIGELDLIISEWRFKIVEKNKLLSNEFTKKKDITTK